MHRQLFAATLVLAILGGTKPAFSQQQATPISAAAILSDDALVERLQLDDQQQQALDRLSQEYEAAAAELQSQLSDLDESDRQQKQLEFEESWRVKLTEILTDEQQTQLLQFRIEADGMALLADPDIASRVGLSDDQRQQVLQYLRSRTRQMQDADARRERIVRAVFERRFADLLNSQQQTQWEEIAEPSSTPTAEQSIVSGTTEGSPTASDDQIPTPATVASTSEDSSQTVASPSDTPSDTTPNAASSESLAPEAGNATTSSGELRFNFRYAPWKDVLDWFAEQANLSMVMDAPPPGTFNYVDARVYTPAEAIDLLNSVLLTKGYTLVRRQRMLLVINLEDGIPPNLVTTVALEDLEDRGEFELVSVLFSLNNVEAEQADEEIQKLIGPQGSVSVLGAARQVFVTETAGRLRTIRDVLRAMEDPDGNQRKKIDSLTLKHISPEAAFTTLRQMLGIPEEQLALPDESLRMTTDVSGQRILFNGNAETIAHAKEIVEMVDVPPSDGSSVAGSMQLEVYSVTSADPDAVLEVMQTLMADSPEIRLATDSKTGNLIALAYPAQHATIRATIQQMERDGDSIEVIPLKTLDPQLAVLSIKNLFGSSEEGESSGPRVEADLTANQLLVRGSASEVAQIRDLLQQMGDGTNRLTAGVDRDTAVRTLTMSPTEADALLQQIEQIWPTIRQNRIRRVVPSNAVRSVAPRSFDRRGERNETEREATPPPSDGTSTQPATPAGTPTPSKNESTQKQGLASASQLSPRLARASDTLLAQVDIDYLQLLDSNNDTVSDPAETGDAASQDDDQSVDDQTRPRGQPGADIIVAPGPGGLTIASQDIEALNAFEDLLRSLADRQTTSGPEYAIFYLKHATAESAAAVINSVLSSGGAGAADGGDDLMGMMMGGDGGGEADLMGMLGMGGAAGDFTPSGTVSIVPDPRLNMLIVQANTQDLELVEELLEIIDQRKSPEDVETVPAPRLIPVLNTSAESVAQVVREVYSNRIAGAAGQQGQMSPEDLIRAMRGGRGGRGGGGNELAQVDEQQMTVGVDARSNSLIVAAPDYLFQEVEKLVAQLDRQQVAAEETTRVITLRQANPELVRQALSTLVGQTTQATTPQAGAAGGASPAARGGRPDNGGDEARRQEEMNDARRRQIEMFRAMQQRRQGGGERRGGGGRFGGRRGGGGRD